MNNEKEKRIEELRRAIYLMQKLIDGVYDERKAEVLRLKRTQLLKELNKLTD